MTVNEIKSAIQSLKQLYIYSDMIEVLFLDDLTETIQVKFIDSGRVTFVTKASITDKEIKNNFIDIDNLLILRF